MDSNSIYINAYREQEAHFLVDIETLIIINIYKISGNDRNHLYIKLVDGEPQPSCVSADLSRIKYEIVSSVPDATLACIWPVIVIDKYVIAGLCSVARQIIKCSENKKVRKLLGFREACLMACSESSIWTKFCEIDMISTVKDILKNTAHYVVDDHNLMLPSDIMRFEYHLKQPVRMHNVYKVAREHNNDKDISSKVPLDQLNLHHTFGEGLFMTLSDIILYPCFQIFFELFPQECITGNLPLINSWFNTMTEKSFMKLKFSSNSPHTYNITQTSQPEVVQQSLYIADPSRYKPERRIYTKQKDIVNSLKIIGGIDISNLLFPYGDEIKFDWSKIPPDANPTGGALPEKRAYRKREQLENLAKAVIKLAGDEKHRIVDFCSGSGHLGILMAYLLPNCEIILIENKELSLTRAKERIANLGLNNVLLLQSNLDYFVGVFDIGVSLHACGVATDLVIQNCIKNKAHFVCCPCCYGGIHDCYHLTYPRSAEYQRLIDNHKDYLTLAHAADQTHEPNIAKTTQGFVCMDAIDTDRRLYAESCGYEVHLGKLQPFSCTNKNNLLVGIFKNSDDELAENDSYL